MLLQKVHYIKQQKFLELHEGFLVSNKGKILYYSLVLCTFIFSGGNVCYNNTEPSLSITNEEDGMVFTSAEINW